MSLDPTTTIMVFPRVYSKDPYPEPTITNRQAKAILLDAKKNMSKDKISKINKSLSEIQAVDILLKGLEENDEPMRSLIYHNIRVLLLGKSKRYPQD